MRRGTTPVFKLNVTGETFAGSTVYVTIRQGSYTVTKTGEDLDITPDGDNSTIEVGLTQSETLLFKDARASIQIRWITSTGVAAASRIKSFDVDPILLEGEIAYAEH